MKSKITETDINEVIDLIEEINSSEGPERRAWFDKLKADDDFRAELRETLEFCIGPVGDFISRENVEYRATNGRFSERRYQALCAAGIFLDFLNNLGLPSLLAHNGQYGANEVADVTTSVLKQLGIRVRPNTIARMNTKKLPIFGLASQDIEPCGKKRAENRP